MKKSNLLILVLAGAVVVACNGGSSNSSSSNGGGSSSGYTGPQPEQYSSQLPNNQGQLITTNYMVYPANVNESIVFMVKNFKGDPLTVNFSVMSSSGSILKVGSNDIQSCSFSSTTTSCSFLISGYESGSYSIIPTVDSNNLQPIYFTTLNSQSLIISGNYTLTGTSPGKDCEVEQIAGVTFSVSNGQACTTYPGQPTFCTDVANPFTQNMPYSGSHCDSWIDGVCIGWGVTNVYNSGGNIYNVTSYSYCPGQLYQTILTKI